MYTVGEFPDGAVFLDCGMHGMETDLIFASGCTKGDPLIETQRKILEAIAKTMNATIDDKSIHIDS